ncbi:MAG: hypothetical protein GX493_08240 [Firmicutes bacterium]|nr:hypothetical protein [Bacillota bacterium]
MSEPRITDLPYLVAGLPPTERSLFDRIFHVATTTGELVAPTSMHPWIEKFFGSVAAVASQRIVKVTNLVTMEGALFNELRANRPFETGGGEEVRRAIAESQGDPFCRPEEGTPADPFGRLRGETSITASNVAKYDGFHGLVVFNEHNPLLITREAVRDYFLTAHRWAMAALAYDPEARYYFFLWNCLWKSGASIVHGHAQMTVTKKMHYAKIEGLRRAAWAYGERFYGQAGEARLRHYFDDLYRVHAALGLTWEKDGVRGLAYLTPIKEKEVVLLAAEEGPALYDEVHRILEGYRRLGIESFNVALIRPPLAPPAEDWNGFPVMVRLVDRGDPNNKTADFGGMELYAASVVASDPFKVAALYR